MRIGIIGGGASGMAAALAAAENEHVSITLLERQARLGRKLGATGNGRCNLSNLHALEGGYHGENPEFSRYALEAYPPEETLDWFYKLGLFTVCEASGRVYPYSDQANSVVDVLRFGLEKPNIQVITGFEAEKIRKTGEKFLVSGQGEEYAFDRVIVACGGLAGTKLGGSMNGYKLLRSLGHSCTKLRPALVQIKTGWRGISGLKGVRANCKAEIFRDGRLYAASCGEIQFTEWGLSGPVMFEISRDVCREKGDWQCHLDFLPEVSGESLRAALKEKCSRQLSASELFTGILHNRLGRVLIQSLGIPLNASLSDFTEEDIQNAARCAKSFQLSLTEPMGMDSAQVTAGGIRTEEWNGQTMESKLLPGLYACGELLDVDGDCGGYNLQWAWSSGRLAGRNAGKEKYDSFEGYCP